jgi:hypothetical protein
VESRDVEAWFRELRKGNPQKKEKPLADPTIDKIRRIMSLVYKHGQRHNYVPRQQEGNPMNWVSQRTTSDYRALIMTPKQAFEVLLNIPEPRRTLTLSDAATGLAGVGIARIDVDGSRLRRVGDVRSASLCMGKVQGSEVEGFEGTCSHASAIVGVHARLARKDALSQRQRLRVSERGLGGKKPLSASIMVQKYLRPAAVKAGVIASDWKGRFGFHNFRHSLATAMVKLRVDPKTVQGILRHEDFGTTMDLYAQSDMESMRDAQGKFLEQLMGDKIHLLTGRVQ